MNGNYIRHKDELAATNVILRLKLKTNDTPALHMKIQQNVTSSQMKQL